MLEIRQYHGTDFRAVLALYNASQNSVFAIEPNNSDLRHPEATYIESGGEFLVGVIHNRIVATVACRPVTSRIVQVQRFHVAAVDAPEVIGEKILTAIAGRAADLRYDTLRVVVRLTEIASLRLYERCGFEETVRRTDLDGNTTMIYLQKHLTK